MTDERAARIITVLPECEFILKRKFLRYVSPTDGENKWHWVITDKFDPIRDKRKKGRGVIEISRDTIPDKVYYQNGYPHTVVAYGLYHLRDPASANLTPLRDVELNCVAQRVVEHVEGALRGQRLTLTRRQKVQEWEERDHDAGATVDDVANLEKIGISLERVSITVANTSLEATGSEVKYSSTTTPPGRRTSTARSPEKSLYTRATSGWLSGRLHRVSRLRSGCWEVKISNSQPTISCSRTAAQSEHRKLTRDTRIFAEQWVTCHLPRKSSERTMQLASMPRKRMFGSQLRPAFFQTARRIA